MSEQFLLRLSPCDQDRTPVDKSNKTIMYKEEYTDKMENTLYDKNILKK